MSATAYQYRWSDFCGPAVSRLAVESRSAAGDHPWHCYRPNEGATTAAFGLITATFTSIPVVGLGMEGIAIGQMFPGRADEFVFLRIVGHLVGGKGVGFVAGALFLAEGIVLQVIAYPLLFQIRIILFTPIGTIGDDVLRQAPQLLPDPFQVRHQAARVSRALVHAEANYKLTFRPHLQVIPGLELPILHVIVFHAHESRIDIRLRIAVAAG